jgi:hypothetical protein
VHVFERRCAGYAHLVGDGGSDRCTRHNFDRLRGFAYCGPVNRFRADEEEASGMHIPGRSKARDQHLRPTWGLNVRQMLDGCDTDT